MYEIYQFHTENMSIPKIDFGDQRVSMQRMHRADSLPSRVARCHPTSSQAMAACIVKSHQTLKSLSDPRQIKVNR